jgi:hypothetical protein
MNQRLLRLALLAFAPAFVALTVACGLGYVVVQQALRAGANDPQVQLAEDGARALDIGVEPASLIGPGSAAAGFAGPALVDPSVSLAPFVVIYDVAGIPVATNATLAGGTPKPPSGVLETARSEGIDKVTWQPGPGVRIAIVVVPWRGGTILAGRSLRLVEEQEDRTLLLAGAAGLAGLTLLVVVSLGVAWVVVHGDSAPPGGPAAAGDASPLAGG